MGTKLPSPKGAQPPIFGPYPLRPNGCIDQDATWYGLEVGLGPGDFGLDGDPAPPSPKKGAELPPSKFLAYVYCGQTAGWIKMVLGIEVGLSPGDFVLDGNPAPLSPKRVGGQSP